MKNKIAYSISNFTYREDSNKFICLLTEELNTVTIKNKENNSIIECKLDDLSIMIEMLHRGLNYLEHSKDEKSKTS